MNFKNLIITCVILLMGTFACINKVNNIADEYCGCLEKNSQLSVQEQIMNCEEILGDLVGWDDSEEVINSKYRELDSLLRQECVAYNEIQKSFVFDNGEWISLEKEKETNLTDSECEEFKEYQDFYYLEPTGDTTRLKIMNNLWMDNFGNGRYFSFLDITWLTPCEFQVEMKETTEPQRKEYFQKGDMLNYKILDRAENYFLMMVTYKDIRQEFKLYVSE